LPRWYAGGRNASSPKGLGAAAALLAGEFLGAAFLGLEAFLAGFFGIKNGKAFVV
jgi:hypothetical protein